MKFKFSDSGRVWEPRYGLAFGPVVDATGFIRHRIPWPVWAMLAVLVLAFAHSAAKAQGVPLTNVNPNMFDNIANAYAMKAKGWESAMQSIANSLFGGLAVISLAWTFIKLLLQKDDVKAFIPTITLQILTLGFFAYLINEGSKIAQMIIGSFEQAAARVTDLGTLTPSGIAINGLDCAFRIMDKVIAMDAMDSITVGLPLLVCGIVLCLAFVGVSILLLVTLIESYFVIYAGVIMLGFGALPWTREIPKNYLIYAINVGVKLFVINLVAGIGVQFSSDWPGLVRDSDIDAVMHLTLYLMSGGLVFLAVAWKVPGIAGALTSGALNFNASDAMGTTAAAAGAGAAAGAVVTGGVSTLANATKGAMQAATSGVSLAKEQGASGIGAALKGIGLASEALASEAGSAAKAQAGLKPPSPHALDDRGRSVDNLGTRAANNLQEKAQKERELRAAEPAGVEAPADPPASSPPSEAPPVSIGAAGQGSSAGSSPAGSAPPKSSGNGTGAKPATGFYSPEGGGAGDTAFKDAAASNSSTRLKPPTLPPPDQGNGGVSINLGNSDD